MPEGAQSPMPPGYRFVRILGSGGAGWVALAEHEVLRRTVAIKTVYGGGLDADSRRRLEREGQALARLVHPCIVRVYEITEVAGDAVLVMEYVAGTDLSTHLRARSLSAPALVQVLTDVAEALDFAAEHGVVHRDVKPAQGDTPAMLMAQHVMASPIEPRRVRPELDEATARLLVAGLDKDPAARPSPGALMRGLAGSAVAPALSGHGDDVAGSPPGLDAMPWITAPTVSAPTARRTVSPLLAGALLAAIVVLVVLLLRR